MGLLQNLKDRAMSVVAPAQATPPAALSPEEWRPFKLLEKRQVTTDAVFVRFGLPESETLGLTVASCLMTRAHIPKLDNPAEKEEVVRPYTPVSWPDITGHFDLVVKVYPNGKMSRHIGSLEVGDELEVKGPIAKLPYKPNMKKHIGMIAGGTGITPMLQVADEILRKDEDHTRVTLVYASQLQGNIILQDKIDEMAKAHDQFRVYYVVDKTIDSSWTGGVGYITDDIVKEFMPGPSEDDGLVLVCGPPPMMKAISGDKAPDKSQGELTGLLGKLGYKKENVFKF